ncbi:3'-5' exonuclease [Paenibacillus arenosi]|uniref:Exonuclease domain-containing protein n=1 Tax=Paenibacillus arenosi TaxID=2774142 RepID=A0ABR9B1D1_9BACL|nr:3'-5' exonuclease [Paenibacillus arenosi]MBD8500144.1 exonuclease domain-containing protein [Paenibacillus arenosi]
MIAIIYDLEMTVTRRKGQISEIIEIGAVKLTHSEGKAVILDTFQTFVKPTLTSRITEDTTSFTGISQQDVTLADELPAALDRFVAWIDAEEYALCSWGRDDKVQFTKECRLKKIPLRWLKNYTDVQQQISALMGRPNKQQIGLKTALEELNLPFVGSHHRALDDAYNTALLYIHFAEKISLHQNKTTDHAAYESEIYYKDTSNDDKDSLANSPFAALQRLKNDSE